MWDGKIQSRHGLHIIELVSELRRWAVPTELGADVVPELLEWADILSWRKQLLPGHLRFGQILVGLVLVRTPAIF